MTSSKLLIIKTVVFVASMAVLVGLLQVIIAVDREVEFTDSGLEAAVREALGEPDGPLFKTSLLTISRLDASNRGITRLEGIEALRHLVFLNLENNRVEDLSPLATLTKLRELNLGNNNITDLEKICFGALSRLPLRTLNLSHNVTRMKNGGEIRLSEVSLLGSLTALEKLELRDNHIEDISPLSSLKNLCLADLRGNRITDITPLAGLTALKELNLRDNDLVDLSPLAGLSNLEYLNIHSNTRIASIAPLSSLTGLQTLIMRNVPVGDEICFLRNLTNLRRLNIRNCGITTITTLAELMAAGALQDKPEQGIEAAVDIRNNNIVPQQIDTEVSMSLYWENITNRNPFFLSSAVFLEPPVFSAPGGFYGSEFYLSLESKNEDEITLYTLDGSEPDINNVESDHDSYEINYFYPESWKTSELITRTNQTYIYSEPIKITDRTGQNNDLSDIITTYREAPDIWWERPFDHVYKGTVVKARTYNGSCYSRTVTHSYFIGEKDRYSLPVVSISTDPRNLFSNDTGIYVPGKIYFDEGGTEDAFIKKGNYRQSGQDWERPAHIEYFESNGELAFSQNVGLRIHGGGSRDWYLKSLRIYARSEYDAEGIINYEFFEPPPELETASLYKRLLLRAGGNVNDHIRDAAAHTIMSTSNAGIQRSRPVIHFINGEYWGIMHIRDRQDRFHLAYRYGLDPDNIIILNSPVGIINDESKLEAGTMEDIHFYNDLYHYIVENDLSQDEHYEHVQSLLCIDSYIDYYIMFIYLANVDWEGDRHFRFWRVRETLNHPYGDGKWRIMIWDFDRAFESYNSNQLKKVIEDYELVLFTNLLENENFKNLFINRFADQINTTFHPERINRIIDDHYESIQEELDEHFRRWGQNAARLSRIDSWKEFARERPDRQREQIMNIFNIPGTATLTLRTDPSKGLIRINTIEIAEDTPGVEDPGNWSGIYFQGIPVQISAIPHAGYRFSGWQEKGQSEAEITLVLTEDTTLTAIFTGEQP